MDLVLQKICVSYGTIKRISKYFDKKTLLVLYNSLIISHKDIALQLGILVIKPQPQKFNELLINLYN